MYYAKKNAFDKKGNIKAELFGDNGEINSEALKEWWNKYQKNFEYAEGIEFEDIMNCLEIMIEQFVPVGV